MNNEISAQEVVDIFINSNAPSSEVYLKLWSEIINQKEQSKSIILQLVSTSTLHIVSHDV